MLSVLHGGMPRMVLSLSSISAVVLPLAFQGAVLWLVDFDDKRANAYNILWVLVFGFATLNILALITRRFEPSRRSLSFGELLAVLVVVVSFLMLGWEMLYIFRVLPIKLPPR